VNGLSLPDPGTLALFVAATFGLLLSPGPNMALVVSQGLAHGPRGGVAGASGIALADLVLTMLVAAGVAALFAAWAPSFDLLRYAGAAYVAWLAFGSLRRRRDGSWPRAQAQRTAAIVRLAMLTSLLNPKALLFFLVFLPQFVEVRNGHVATQLLFLGIVLTAIAFAFHAGLGIASAKARAWAGSGIAAVAWMDRLQAAVFLGIAIRLVFLSRPAGM
jgi:threonine/homoserine/homoserine lactone efflux protein